MHPIGGALNPLATIYTTKPGSADETSLRLLANWRDGESCCA